MKAASSLAQSPCPPGSCHPIIASFNFTRRELRASPQGSSAVRQLLPVELRQRRCRGSAEALMEWRVLEA